jgi:hypothetical protein
MYFYDGELPVVDGTLTIPADRPEWVQRAWIMGFRLTAEGRVIADLAKHVRAETADTAEVETTDDLCCSDDCCQPETEELAALCCQDGGCCSDDEGAGCACTPVVETETAESGEETDTDASPDRGRQPAGEDGVRTSEPDRSEGDAEGELAGSGGSSPADEE